MQGLEEIPYAAITRRAGQGEDIREIRYHRYAVYRPSEDEAVRAIEERVVAAKFETEIKEAEKVFSAEPAVAEKITAETAFTKEIISETATIEPIAVEFEFRCRR